MASTVGKKVAVIGAGPAGLPAMKHCIEEGLTPVCFEKLDDIGGTWYYKEKPIPNQGPCVYKELVTNDSKELLCYSDFPFPDDCPTFVPHARYLQYLQDYASKFNLRQFIKFSHTVTSVRPASDYNQSGKWDLTVRNDVTNQSEELTFDAVMLCTGFLAQRKIPDLPGLKSFKGEVLHSIDYRTRQDLVDKRVLVVGNGIYAGEIAGEGGLVASQVYLSIGEEAWLSDKYQTNHLPLDYVFSRLYNYNHLSVEQAVGNMVQGFLSRFDHKKYGLGSTHIPFLDCGVLYNDSLAGLLDAGKVIIKPRLTEMTQTGAKFSDGSSIDDIDVVMFATGFLPALDFIECEDMKGDNTLDWNIYKYVFPINAPHPTLALIGLTHYTGAVTPMVEMKSRWGARVLAGKCHLPSRTTMMDHLEANRKFARQHLRGKNRMNPWAFQQQIAEEIGVKPSFWRLLLWSPRLAYRFIFGPQFPVYYRLVGPGALPDPVQQCERAHYRAFHTPDYSKPDKIAFLNKWKKGQSMLSMVIVPAIFLGLLAVLYQYLSGNLY